MIRALILLTCLLCACSQSAPPSAPPDGAGPIVPTGVIAGRVIVTTANRPTRIDELEPNDDLDTSQVVEAGASRIEIHGALTADDPVDVYTVRLDGPARATVILSFDSVDGSTDLAFSVFDGHAAQCTGPGDHAATTCIDTSHTPEVGRFDLDGDFVLAVGASRGMGPYEIGIQLSLPAVPQSARNRVPGELLVRFVDGTRPHTCRRLLADCGFREGQRSPSGVYRAVCRQDVDTALRDALTDHAARRLAARAEVVYAEPNTLIYPATVPNDEYFGNQWHYDMINLEEAWDITIGDEDVIVAVIDTGIIDHPDISERLVDGFDFISDPDVARDGDGIDDDPTDEGDLAGGPNLSTFHGVHIAGTIGATTDNDFGISGVTWATGIMPLRALGAGGGTAFDLSEAIAYAAGLQNVSGTLPKQRADVINLSVAAHNSVSPPSNTLGASVRAAAAAGVILVGAAGNNGTDRPAYPAAFDEVLSVAACDPRLQRAVYSNYGPTIDITGPGGDIALDVNGDGFGDGILSLGVLQDDDVRTPVLALQQGTSMACPHVTGVIALMLAANPKLTPAEVRELLTATAADLGQPGRDDLFGAGLVDAAAAVAAAAARAGDDSPGPRLSVSSASLDFGRSLSQLKVLIANAGTGMLEIDDIRAEPRVGTGWLSVTPGAGNDATSVATLTVNVDRTDLADGRYLGTITLVSTQAGTRTIDVAMTVGRALVLDETLFVVVIDADSRRSVAQAETSAERAFNYLIRSLPAGRYQLYAGTDRDDDGLICDLGELCGALPTPIDAIDVDLEDGEQRHNLDFAVGELIFQAQSASSIPVRGIPLAGAGQPR